MRSASRAATGAAIGHAPRARHLIVNSNCYVSQLKMPERAVPPKAYARSSRFLRVASAKSPLTLSLSPQARLGELASQRGRIRRRMRLGEEDARKILCGNSGGPSPRPHPLAGAAAKDASTPWRACAEKDRMRGPFADAPRSNRPDLPLFAKKRLKHLQQMGFLPGPKLCERVRFMLVRQCRQLAQLRLPLRG